MLLLAPETLKGQKLAVSRTRTGLIAQRPNLCSRMPIARAPYAFNSKLEAHLVAEIEAPKKVKTFTETLFWFARIQSSGQAGIIIIKSGHEEHCNRGTSGSVALLVVEIQRALTFATWNWSVYLGKDASTIQATCNVSYARDALSEYAIGLSACNCLSGVAADPRDFCRGLLGRSYSCS